MTLRTIPRLPSLLLLAAVAVAGSGPAGAQQLESFVLTAGGLSTCHTYGTPAPVFSRFGVHGVSEPAGGFAACGVTATQRLRSAPGGTLSDAMALQTSWGSPLNDFDGTTSVQARFGNLHAAARSVYSGSTSSSTVDGAESFATCRDTLTISSPSATPGSTGYVRIHVRVSGSLSTTKGISDVELYYLLGDSIVYTLFRGQAYDPAAVPFLIAGTGPQPTGFTLSPGAASGGGVVVTFWTPFTFGAPLDFELRLLAYTVPSSTGTTAVDFRSRVVDFEVFGAGQLLDDFRVASAAGVRYGSLDPHQLLTPPPILLPFPLGAPGSSLSWPVAAAR